jgi:transposase
MGFPAGVGRDFEALERRRMRAASLLAKGVSQSEVARRVGAHRQSVSKWAAELQSKGRAGLRKAGRAGRKPRLSAEQIKQVERGLKRGPQALGYETSLWTANRVVHLIEQECGVSYHPGHVWKILRRLGWSCQRPAGRALERDEKAIQRWKKERWPELKKKAKNQGRIIVFIDESGLSERPHRCRTWAPRGQTPVLQYHFNWKTLSAMAGVTWWNFYFRLFPGAIKSPQVVQFLEHLMRHLSGKLLIIWDGLRSHRSRLVWEFVRQQRGRLWLEFLPAYAPELNPVEYLWSHWKQHELPNFCPTSFAQLSVHARRALKRMRRRPTLVMAFWQQAQLFPL